MGVRRIDPADLRRKAEHFLRQSGFTKLPVDPFEVAASLDIVVQAKPAIVGGVSGMLVRHGDTFGILYATHIPSAGFQRFSIAHELGHFLIEGHPEAIFAAGETHASRAGFVTKDPYEIEADHYAAGLLMPDALFRAAAMRVGDGLEAIEELADRCVTSLTATAIRYAQTIGEPAAVVVSSGPRIDYAFLSDAMREFAGVTWPRKGDLLPDGTATERFNADPENVRQRKRLAQEADLRAWFGTRRRIDATEEVVGLGEYGRTLTVITTDSLPEEADEEDQLEESWTPRFRRR
ncbi:MAG: ImmA/IrrE family metallo-endopeptidase [Acetobacteraceae bacterium]|nr:ImmA/IrrE family metallo-endopeptidase [Acetobacteraceae bacterium]